jgi:hypothetical protein
MPTITFRVNLETVNSRSAALPYPADQVTSMASCRVAWFPNRLLGNRQMKHGDEFALEGMDALYVRDNYTSGEFKFLDVVSTTP